MARVFLTLVAILACAAPALAIVNTNAPLRTLIIPQIDSPVRITACSALANDFVATYSDPPQYLYTQVHTEVAFTNLAKSDVAAVRFAFEVDDSFNRAYDTFLGTAHGRYSPGVTIEPHRQGLLNVLQDDATAWNANVNGQDIGLVGCYVQGVRFSDDTVWNADIKAEIQANKAAAAEPAKTDSQVLNPMPKYVPPSPNP